MPVRSDDEIIFRGRELEWDPPKVNISKYLLECMKTNGNRVAQLDPVTKKQHSYNDLRVLSIRCALEMQSRGFKKTDFATICCSNHLYTCVPFLATLYLGGIVSPIHSIFSDLEYQRMLAKAQPKLIFCDARYETNIRNALKVLNLNSEVVVMERDFEKFISGTEDLSDFQVVDVDAESIAVLVCTSGTTGFVKGVPLTHRSFFVSIADTLKWGDPDDICVVYSAISWSSGFKTLAQAIIAGSCRIITNYHPDKNLPLLSEYKVTTLLSSPQKVIEMIRHPDFPKYNVQSHIQRVLYGGYAVTPEQARMFHSVFPNSICFNGYGSSEMCGLHAWFDFDDPMNKLKANSVGRLFLGMEAKILDLETGNTLGKNQKGELCLRSKYMMKGYYEDEEETRKVIDKDGFLHTSDIAYFDDDECLFCVDRIKDVFKVGGYQVSPTEIENALLEHPGVCNASVIGKPDEIDGYIPAAFIVKYKNWENLTEKDILDFTKDKLTETQQLRGGVKFVNKFPMTISGKVRKIDLRNMLVKEDLKN